MDVDLHSLLTPSESASNIGGPSNTSFVTRKVLKQTSVRPCTSITSKEMISKLDAAFADMIYYTGVPFRFADHKKVVEFVKLCRPSYQPPSAKKIAGSMLNAAHKKLLVEIDGFIEDSQYVSIVSDGWSNINNQRMVNFVACVPGQEPVLFDAVNTEEIAQEGEEIAAAIEERILKIGLEKVVGVVTDNASNIQKAWKILETKYPGLICNGCGAHTFNLIVKDICKLEAYADTLERCRDLTEFLP